MANFNGDPTPGELVKRFSWEMENRENVDTDSEEFAQLRMDFVEQTQVSTGGKDMEIRRLEAYFSKTW